MVRAWLQKIGVLHFTGGIQSSQIIAQRFRFGGARYPSRRTAVSRLACPGLGSFHTVADQAALDTRMLIKHSAVSLPDQLQRVARGPGRGPNNMQVSRK